MRVIFLDIDGVLNDHRPHGNGYCGFKSECVSAFNQLLAAVPDAQIVVSSAWRYMIIGADMSRKGFEYLLLVGGVDCKGRVRGWTASDEQVKTRGGQILEWLKGCPGCRSFVVIDDMPWDFAEKGIHHVVLTDASIGFTEHHARLAAVFLK